MGLFGSSSPAEKEIKKYVGGFILKSDFRDLLKANGLYDIFPSEGSEYMGICIRRILEYKTSRNKVKVSDVEKELYLLLRKAIYLKNRKELFVIKTCPKCNKKLDFSACPTCGFNFIDNHKIDYDELKQIQISFPHDSRSPYRKVKANDLGYIDNDAKNNYQPHIRNKKKTLVNYKNTNKSSSKSKQKNNSKSKNNAKVPPQFKNYEIKSKLICCNCNKKTVLKLIRPGLFSDKEVRYCPNCGLTLEKSGDKFKLTKWPSTNKNLELHHNQRLTWNEWKRIGKGGKSDKENEETEKLKNGEEAYAKGIQLFKKGNRNESHRQFSAAKSNLPVSSVERSIASIYCSAFDLVNFNKYLADNPENFHRPTLKSANYHIGMELMNFNPIALQRLSTDRYNELIMVIDFIIETLLEIPKNNYYNLNFFTHKEKSVAELWKKIAKYTLKIKENSRIYYLIGCLRTKDGSYEDPEPCFKKAVRRASNNDPHIYIEIGDFYSDEMQYFSKAAYYYTKAMRFDSMRTAENYKALGSFYGLDGYHEDAVHYFDKGIECPDADFDIYGRKAQSLLQLGRFEEADECFDEFFRLIDIEIKANPRDINLLRAKAVTLASVGEKRKALDIFLKIEEINPNAEFLEDDLRRLGI